MVLSLGLPYGALFGDYAARLRHASVSVLSGSALRTLCWSIPVCQDALHPFMDVCRKGKAFDALVQKKEA